jgi:hypothetical protein
MKVNLTVVSSRPDTTSIVFADLMESMATFFRIKNIKVSLSKNKIFKDSVNILWGVGTHYSRDFKLINDIGKNYKIILVNLEQLGSSSELVTGDYLECLMGNKLFDYSDWNIRFLRGKFSINPDAIEFPFFPSVNKNFIEYSSSKKEFDFSFYGAINDRRLKILKNILSRGYTIDVIKNIYGPHLVERIKKSKAVLNIHYYDSKIFETTRCIGPVGMGWPILSEDSFMPVKVNWDSSGIVFLNYDEIYNKLEFMNDYSLGIMSERSIRFLKGLKNDDFLEVFNFIR